MQRRHVRSGVDSERTRTVGRSPVRVAASPHIRAIFGSRPPSPTLSSRRQSATAPHGGGAATGTSWGRSGSHTPRGRATPPTATTPRSNASTRNTNNNPQRLTESVVRNHRASSSHHHHAQQDSARYNQGGRTPGGRSDLSTGSTNLTSMIADAMSVRMQSMADLRQRIEELTLIQAREEASLHDQWSRIQHQSEHAVRSAQEETEHYFREQLEKERGERLKAIELMQRFRTEGEVTMRKLKDALQEAQLKWKEEVNRNAKLTATLKQSQQTTSLPRGGGGDSVSGGGGDSSDEVIRLRSKLGVLTSLLEEEDAVVMELQCRNKVLEHGMSAVLVERDRLTVSLNESSTVSESLDQEYGTLLHQLNSARESKQQAVAQREDSGAVIAALEGQFNILNKFTALLVKRLKNEQRQRLVSEEQSARVASAQEQMINKLESRVKELLSSRRPSSPTIDSPRERRTPVDFFGNRHSSVGAASHTSVTFADSEDEREDSTVGTTNQFNPPPQAGEVHYQSQQDESQPASPLDSSSRRDSALQEYLKSSKQQKDKNNALLATNDTSSPRLEAYRAARAAAAAKPSQRLVSHPQTSPSKERPYTISPPRSTRDQSIPLEERLAAVSADFNHSIDELARTLHEPTPTPSSSNRPSLALKFSPSEERYFDHQSSRGSTQHQHYQQNGTHTEEDDLNFDPEEF